MGLMESFRFDESSPLSTPPIDLLAPTGGDNSLEGAIRAMVD